MKKSIFSFTFPGEKSIGQTREADQGQNAKRQKSQGVRSKEASDYSIKESLFEEKAPNNERQKCYYGQEQGGYSKAEVQRASSENIQILSQNCKYRNTEIYEK